MSNCDCNDLSGIVISDDCSPPFLTVDTFLDYTSRFCSNCTAVDDMSVLLDNEDYISHFSLDACCPVLTIYKGSQIIQSFDGGSTWIETGTAYAEFLTTLGSTTLTAGSTVTPNLYSTNTAVITDVTNMVELSTTVSGLKILKMGSYVIETEFRILHPAGTAYIDVEMFINGLASTPKNIVTSTQTFSNIPSENSGIRHIRLTSMVALNANSIITYVLSPKNNAMTGNAWFNTSILKLSNG